MTEGRWSPMMCDGWGVIALLGVLFSIALLLLVILAVVWLARNLGSDGGQRRATPPEASRQGAAREVLDMRYARGEIGREEYLQARRDLEGPHS
jgi:putative membrane protein